MINFVVTNTQETYFNSELHRISFRTFETVALATTQLRVFYRLGCDDIKTIFGQFMFQINKDFIISKFENIYPNIMLHSVPLQDFTIQR